MLKPLLFTLALAVFLTIGGPANAHTPLCSCYDNDDGTITCEGGFSDGSSAAGVTMRVVDSKGQVQLKGKMDEFSEYTFDKPKDDYVVEFDAGEGHLIKIKSKDITN